jgi:two-component system, LytTR family, sensor histidine kinase AlgZ
MHPILAGRLRIAAYLAAWLSISLLLELLLWFAAPLRWYEAAALALPLGLFYAFVCLGAFWVVHAAPLRPLRLPQALLRRIGAAGLSAFAWLLVARGCALGLERAGLPDLAARQGILAPLLFGMGFLLFLLAAAFYDLLAAFEASHQSQRRALQLEVASREAELRALRSQLHPHFMFNSLNSINALIAARPEEARRLCVRLGDLLRRSLILGAKERIPLAEELAVSEDLLSIEQVRFGSRLAFQVKADEAARACLVPPLVLQPLVENAVTHGIAQMLEGGTVRVEAEKRGGKLWLTVENPRDPESSAKGTGIGLENVRRRLQAMYGGEATLRVRPADASFRVDLSLPAADEDEPA